MVQLQAARSQNRPELPKPGDKTVRKTVRAVDVFHAELLTTDCCVSGSATVMLMQNQLLLLLATPGLFLERVKYSLFLQLFLLFYFNL